MWANAQRDGRPAKYRWRPLFNATKFGRRPRPEWRAVTLPRRESRWNCCLTSFFPIVDICLSCEDRARQSCTMVPRWRFSCVLYFTASRVQHISGMHSKLTVRPHHVWKYGRHPIADRW